MIKPEFFEDMNDTEIREHLLGNKVKIEFNDGSKHSGLVTNFLQAAVADASNRSIVGLVLNNSEEIVISSRLISNISIIA